MPGKRKKGKKVRVDFRQNRQQRRRESDLTQRYRDTDQRDELVDGRSSESIRAKGDLSRKRTVIVDENETRLIDETQWIPGIITEVHGRVCQVEADRKSDPAGGAPPNRAAIEVWECTVRRVLRTMLTGQRSRVTVGDRVWFSDHSAHHDGEPIGVIERVGERSTVLSRRDRRSREHTIVANADQILIVTSVAQPRIKPHLIDRYLIAAGKGGLRPIVVFNKWDLLEKQESRKAGRQEEKWHGATEARSDEGEDSDEGERRGGEAPGSALAPDLEDDDYAGPPMSVEDLLAEFEALGVCCIRASTTTGLGIDEIADALVGHITVLSGQSGVGKSSLLNRIQPGLRLSTAEVSDESEKGRHTTTLARLLRLESGAHVVDTPGIRTFSLWRVEPGELERYFAEFVPLVPHCRFNDCHHTDETDCAIRTAAESGAISPRRYWSYIKMLEELAEERRR